MISGDPPVGESLVAPTGRFRIYLGAAAGVGKTCAMLDEGWRRRERGRDVVVGFVETHQRQHTKEAIRDLEVVPRRTIQHRGASFEEMDLEAVLARRPQLVLVDELAHTNVPGSGRHAKRWEDVLELLEQGINVISTVNIQHLESLAESIERLTGTKVRERVPDRVVRRADQIELVDSSPEQLRRRMVHGNVYPPERVPDALNHFFSAHNLTILRELALRFVADETEELLLRDLSDLEGPIESAEHLLVAVGDGAAAAAILRRAARIAARVKCDLRAVHVLAGDSTRAADLKALEQLQQLAVELGADWELVHGDDVASALVGYAKKHHVTQLVVGADRVRGWGRGLVSQILKAAGTTLDVHVVARNSAPVDQGGPGKEPGA